MQSEIVKQLEETIIGCILIDQDVMPQITFLEPECFSGHQADVFKTCKAMFNRNEPIDLVTVTSNLFRNKLFTGELTPLSLSNYTNTICSTANVKAYAMKLVEFYVERELLKTGIEISQEMVWTDSIGIYNTTENKIRDIIGRLKNSEYTSASEIVNQVLKELDQPAENGLTGVPSGFTGMDRITGGWQNTDLYILAARPGMGKTAMMLTMAKNAAIEFGYPVAIFSHEMSSTSLMKRLISLETEIPLDRIMKRQIADHWKPIIQAASKVASDNIILDDCQAGNWIDLRTKAKKMVKERGVKMIFVDYLQLMKSVENKKNATRDLELAEITYGLKTIAKELNIPVMALSQLSRKVEDRADKRPNLSDLRESGNIEQAADSVMFIYRPEYYGITQDENGNSYDGLAELIIAKNRNGALDTVNLKFIGEFTKFTDDDRLFLKPTGKRF